MKMIFRCLTIFCVIGVINCSAVRNKRSQSFEVTASGTGLDHDIDDFFASSEFPDTQEEDNDYKDTRNKAVMTNQVIKHNQYELASVCDHISIKN